MVRVEPDQLAIEPARLSSLPPDLDLQRDFVVIQSIIRLVQLSVGPILKDSHITATVRDHRLSIHLDFVHMSKFSIVKDTIKRILPTQLKIVDLHQMISDNEIKWMCKIQTTARPLVDTNCITHVSVIRDTVQKKVQKSDLRPTDLIRKVFTNDIDCTRRLFNGTRAPRGLLLASLQYDQESAPAAKREARPTPPKPLKPMIFVRSSEQSEPRVPKSSVSEPATRRETPERDAGETAMKAGHTVYRAIEYNYQISKLTSSSEVLDLVVDYLACESHYRQTQITNSKPSTNDTRLSLSIRSVPYDMMRLKLKLHQLPAEHTALRDLLDRAVGDPELVQDVISTRTATVQTSTVILRR